MPAAAPAPERAARKATVAIRLGKDPHPASKAPTSSPGRHKRVITLPLAGKGNGHHKVNFSAVSLASATSNVPTIGKLRAPPGRRSWLFALPAFAKPPLRSVFVLSYSHI